MLQLSFCSMPFALVDLSLYLLAIYNEGEKNKELEIQRPHSFCH